MPVLLSGAGPFRVRVRTATTLSPTGPVVAAVPGIAVAGERPGIRGRPGIALVLAGLPVLTVPRR